MLQIDRIYLVQYFLVTNKKQIVIFNVLAFHVLFYIVFRFTFCGKDGQVFLTPCLFHLNQRCRSKCLVNVIEICIYFFKLNKCFIAILCHAFCVLLYVSTPSCACPPRRVLVHPVILVFSNNSSNNNLIIPI